MRCLIQKSSYREIPGIDPSHPPASFLQSQALPNDWWPAGDSKWDATNKITSSIVSVEPKTEDDGHTWELDMNLKLFDDYPSSHTIVVHVRPVKGALRALRKYYGGSKADFDKVLQGRLLDLSQTAVSILCKPSVTKTSNTLDLPAQDSLARPDESGFMARLVLHPRCE